MTGDECSPPYPNILDKMADEFPPLAKRHQLVICLWHWGCLEGATYKEVPCSYHGGFVLWMAVLRD